ncbi:MAG: hypothetical protein U1F11_01635 [Steroidobacteraceae bacterium]
MASGNAASTSRADSSRLLVPSALARPMRASSVSGWRGPQRRDLALGLAECVVAAGDDHAELGGDRGIVGELLFDALDRGIQQVRGRDDSAAAGARHRLGEDRGGELLDALGARGLCERDALLPERDAGARRDREHDQQRRGQRHEAAAHELAEPVGEPRRLRVHGFAGEVALDVVGQGLDAAVAALMDRGAWPWRR